MKEATRRHTQRFRSKNPTTDPSVKIRWNLSVGFDRSLKLVPGTNLLKLLISSRGQSKPTDKFHPMPTLGSDRIL